MLSTVKPGEIRAALPADPPEHGEGFDGVLHDLDAVLMPGITHWQHPSFFAYFPANASGPGILGDLLASGLGVQGMIWATSPAATELETHVLDWLATLLDLPTRFRSAGRGAGVIQHSASDAVLVALLAAIHRATGGRTARTGVGTERLTVYTSSQTHSSVEKACRVAGLGTDALRMIDIDLATGAARPDHLRQLVEADRAAGYTPALVVASDRHDWCRGNRPGGGAGSDRAQRGAWLHVDAAWAGVAAVCPELRWLNEGLEFADSYCTNPHKWLLTNFDCDAMWVAERDDIVAALSILPEYLRNAATESGQVIDYRDWHVPLGRRFRALKLWAVIRWYGAEGPLRTRACRRRSRAGIRVLGCGRRSLRTRRSASTRPRHVPAAVRRRGNSQLMERVNAAGRMYLTHTAAEGSVDAPDGYRLAPDRTPACRRRVGRAAARRRRVIRRWARAACPLGRRWRCAGRLGRRSCPPPGLGHPRRMARSSRRGTIRPRGSRDGTTWHGRATPS